MPRKIDTKALEARLKQLKAEGDEPEPKKPKAKTKAPAVKRKAARPKGGPRSSRTAEEKAQLFANAYVRHGCNATLAYKDAISPTCKDTTAQVQGHKYLSKPMVQRYLAPLLEALMEKNEVDAEWVLARWKEQADGSPLDYFYQTPGGDLNLRDLDDFTEVERRNLKSLKVTKSVTEVEGAKGSFTTTTRYTWHVTVQDQQKAVEMFAKYLGLLTRTLDEEEVSRIGDLIEAGVKRIRASKDLDAWQQVAIEGEFSEVG